MGRGHELKLPKGVDFEALTCLNAHFFIELMFIISLRPP